MVTGDTGNFPLMARLWHTSRHVVRKWVRRYQEQGPSGLQDCSLRPKLNDLGYDLCQESALFPPVILDAISTNWLSKTVTIY